MWIFLHNFFFYTVLFLAQNTTNYYILWFRPAELKVNNILCAIAYRWCRVHVCFMNLQSNHLVCHSNLIALLQYLKCSLITIVDCLWIDYSPTMYCNCTSSQSLIILIQVTTISSMLRLLYCYCPALMTHCHHSIFYGPILIVSLCFVSTGRGVHHWEPCIPKDSVWSKQKVPLVSMEWCARS